MVPNSHELSAGVFIRGLTSLKAQLTKAEAHAAASAGGERAMLDARLGADGSGASHAPRDLHMYTLAAHVHWAAEGARLAIAQLLGVRAVPDANAATRFADLHRHLDATMAHLREVTPAELDAGLERTIVIEHPRGTVRSDGRQFLLAFAITHFFYHVTTAYGIMRNQGVPLTMGDFLGNWGTS